MHSTVHISLRSPQFNCTLVCVFGCGHRWIICFKAWTLEQVHLDLLIQCPCFCRGMCICKRLFLFGDFHLKISAHLLPPSVYEPFSEFASLFLGLELWWSVEGGGRVYVLMFLGCFLCMVWMITSIIINVQRASWVAARSFSRPKVMPFRTRKKVVMMAPCCRSLGGFRGRHGGAARGFFASKSDAFSDAKNLCF